MEIGDIVRIEQVVGAEPFPSGLLIGDIGRVAMIMNDDPVYRVVAWFSDFENDPRWREEVAFREGELIVANWWVVETPFNARRYLIAGENKVEEPFSWAYGPFTEEEAIECEWGLNTAKDPNYSHIEVSKLKVLASFNVPAETDTPLGEMYGDGFNTYL